MIFVWRAGVNERRNSDIFLKQPNSVINSIYKFQYPYGNVAEIHPCGLGLTDWPLGDAAVILNKYRKISNIRYTKSQDLNVSRLGL